MLLFSRSYDNFVSHNDGIMYIIWHYIIDQIDTNVYEYLS